MITLEEVKTSTRSKLGCQNLTNIKALIVEAEGEQAFDLKKESMSALAN